MERKYVLILVHLDKDRCDIARNKYGFVGDVVESQEFTKDKDIRYGIYGVLWGKTSSFPYERIGDGYWAVIKTEYNDNFIVVDKYYNTVKIRTGIILHVGSIHSAAQFIISAKDDKSHFFSIEAKSLKESEIAGSEQWLERYKEN